MKIDKENGTVTLSRVGYKIEGIAKIRLWDFNCGYIEMDAFEFRVPDISLDIGDDDLNAKIKENLNDGGFGCESIKGAVVYISDLYERGFVIRGSECYIGDITEDDVDAINSMD